MLIKNLALRINRSSDPYKDFVGNPCVKELFA